MGARKAAGAVLLVLAILLLGIGAVTAIYGALDQEDHEEEAGPFGLGEDEERTDRNERMLVGGATTAAAGFLLLLVALLLLVVPEAAAATGPPGPPRAPAEPDGSEPLVDARAPVALGVVLALVLMSVVVVLAVSGFDGFGDAPDRPTTETVSGTVPASVTVLGEPRSIGSSAVTFTPPDRTTTVSVEVDWDVVEVGPSRLRVVVERDDGEGWRYVEEAAGGPGLTFTFSGDVGGASMRLRAMPADDGATAAQPYEATLTYD